MGTSKNVRSPDTPPWKAALAVLGHLSVPPARQAQEVWRSASAERGVRLTEDLGSPALAAACRIAESTTEPRVAAANFEQFLSSARAGGIGAEIGKRALLRAVSAKRGSQGFASELFAEATAYYVSRDLPSFVAARGRVASTSAAITLKEGIRNSARDVVGGLGVPATDALGWSKFVSRAVRALQGAAR
jgi:hypothetical protein